jgi:hypothetical protein
MIQRMYDKSQENEYKNDDDAFTSFYCVEAFTLDAHLHILYPVEEYVYKF